MASKRFEKDSEEWKLFREYWSICQRFWEPEDNDKYWEQVVDITDDFYEKYKANNEIFVKKIILAFVDTLEEKYRTMRN